MSANRTPNSHMHRLRHRNRIRDPRNHHRKFANYLATQATRITALAGVTSVTEDEIEAIHRTPQSVRGRNVRDVSTAAEATALGLNVA